MLELWNQWSIVAVFQLQSGTLDIVSSVVELGVDEARWSFARQVLAASARVLWLTAEFYVGGLVNWVEWCVILQREQDSVHQQQISGSQVLGLACASRLSTRFKPGLCLARCSSLVMRLRNSLLMTIDERRLTYNGNVAMYDWYTHFCAWVTYEVCVALSKSISSNQ